MYGANQAINQSSFKYINPEEGGSPELFYDFIMGKFEQKETDPMITGTMVHMALFEPEKFIVAEIPDMSDSIKSIITGVFSQAISADFDLEDVPLHHFNNEIVGAAKAINYGQSWKSDTIVAKVAEAGSTYFEILKQGRNKILLSTKQKATIDKIINSIQSNSHLSDSYLNPDPKRFKYFYEHPVYFELDFNGYTLTCKAKIDCLIMDTYNKTFKIIDLKTTSKSVEQFSEIFQERRMYRQLAFYEAAVMYNHNSYQPMTHSILCAESTGYNRVRLFDVGRGFIEKGVKEYTDICDRIAWHSSTNNWSISKEDYENNFVTFLDINTF